MQEVWVWSLGQEDPLEYEMTISITIRLCWCEAQRGQDKLQRPVASPPGRKGLPGLEVWEITTLRGVFSGRDELWIGQWGQSMAPQVWDCSHGWDKHVFGWGYSRVHILLLNLKTEHKYRGHRKKSTVESRSQGISTLNVLFPPQTVPRQPSWLEVFEYNLCLTVGWLLGCASKHRAALRHKPNKKTWA